MEADSVFKSNIYIAGYQIGVVVSKNDNNLSVNEWLDYIKSAPPIMEVSPDQNRKTIYISGVEGIDTMRFECCLGCKREIYLPKNGKMYSLKIQGSIECEQKEKGDTPRCCFIEEYEIVFDKILSTFRFLE